MFQGRFQKWTTYLKLTPLDFIGKEFAHLYQGVPIKAKFKKTLSEKFKFNLAQEGDDIVTDEELMNALNKEQEDGHQYCQLLTGHRKNPEKKCFQRVHV